MRLLDKSSSRNHMSQASNQLPVSLGHETSQKDHDTISFSPVSTIAKSIEDGIFDVDVSHSSRQPRRSTSLVRRRIYEFLSSSPDAPRGLWWASVAYQGVQSLTIIGLFLIDSETEPTETTSTYWQLELIVTSLWFVEYLLRLWSCVDDPCFTWKGVLEARLRCALSVMCLLDLISLVSQVVDLSIQSNKYRGVSSLRMLRLLTLFRIERDFVLGPVLEVIMGKHSQLLATLGVAIFVLFVSSIMMFYAEAPTNPEYNSIAMAMWWGVTALTTVGYGDIVPVTSGGRIIASIVAFMGTGLFGLFAGILADGFREAFKRDRRFRSKQFRTPPRSPGGAPREGGHQPPVQGNLSFGATQGHHPGLMCHVCSSSMATMTTGSFSLASSHEISEVHRRLDKVEGDLAEALMLLRRFCDVN
mmetsp:Transcript_27128/g.57604  ORF Transcript_27128/g.57604 Transcript_27128/m.57604 type:complete len:416 (+) Transcript_27128:24-1271(+)